MTARRLTGCTCGCTPGDPCVTDKPAPTRVACCGSLDYGDLAACARYGITCADRCAREALATIRGGAAHD